MCVAVIINGPTPALSDLCKMEAANPDGGGIAWAAGGAIHYRKGLTARQISEAIRGLPRPYFIHFRIATHGPKVPRLCHPFPLGEAALRSTSTRGKADAVLIHNGTWHDHESWIPDWAKGLPEPSDTAVAAWIAHYYEDILDEVPWATALGRFDKNTGRMDVTTRGTWHEEDHGKKGCNYYSNLYWKTTRSYSYYRSSDYYDRDSFDWGDKPWNGYGYSTPEKKKATPRSLEYWKDDAAFERWLAARDKEDDVIDRAQQAKLESLDPEYAEVQAHLARQRAERKEDERLMALLEADDWEGLEAALEDMGGES